MEAAETGAPEGVIETKRVTVSGLTEGLRKKDLARQSLKLEQQGWTLEEYHDAGMGGSCAIFSRPMLASAEPVKRFTKRHWFAAAVLVFFAACAIFLPGKSPAPAPNSSPAAASAPVANRGLGLSFKQASAVFESYGFKLEKSSDVNGRPRWMGQGKTALVEVIGPSSNIRSMGMTMMLVKGDVAGAAGNMALMMDILNAAFPTWAGRSDWLLGAIQSNGGTTTRDGLRATVSFPGDIGLSFYVRVDE